MGKGSFGSVFAAINVDTGDDFAVKQILPEPEDVRLVQREVAILSRLSHVSPPSARSSPRHGEADGSKPRVLEYLAFQPLQGHSVEIFTELKDGNARDLQRQGYFNGQHSQTRAKIVLLDMLEALVYLAGEKIIHRDVKPANILYEDAAGQRRYQLADFGLSKVVESRPGTHCGSLSFMAPEVDQVQAQGDCVQSCKMDVWSLAATIFWLSDVDISSNRASFGRMQ